MARWQASPAEIDRLRLIFSKTGARLQFRARPVRLAWPRTPPSHGGDRGSNPLRAIRILLYFRLSAVSGLEDRLVEATRRARARSTRGGSYSMSDKVERTRTNGSRNRAPRDRRGLWRAACASTALAIPILLLALTVSALAPPPASASDISSKSGVILLNLDSATDHKIEIEDSLNNRHPGTFTFTMAALPAVAVGLAWVNQAQVPARQLPPPAGPELTAILTAIAGSFLLLQHHLETNQEERDEPTAVLKVSDLAGHPISVPPSPNGPCRSGVRSTTPGGSRYLPYTIECDIMPGIVNLGLGHGPTGLATRLVVIGGSQSDDVVVSQHFPEILDYRYITGAGGPDTLVGSSFDDEIVGGPDPDKLRGRGGIDWLQLSGDSQADDADCGGDTPPPGSQDLGDLADPGWEDFPTLQNCEDIAYPAPENGQASP